MLCKFLWSQDLAEATRSCVGNGVGGKQQLPVYCGEHGYLLVIPIPGCQTVTMEQRNLGALSLGPWEMSQEPNSKSQEKNGNTTPHRCQPEHNKAMGSHKAVHVLNSRLHRGLTTLRPEPGLQVRTTVAPASFWSTALRETLPMAFSPRRHA